MLPRSQDSLRGPVRRFDYSLIILNLRRSTLKFCYVCLVAMLCTAFSGCGPGDDGLPRTVPAKGMITLNGAPVEGASIVFLGDDGSKFARAISDAAGRFSADTYETKSGAVPGAYKVTVSKTVTVENAVNNIPKGLEESAEHAGEMDPGQGNVSWVNDLPKQYASPVTSGLAVNIPEDGVTDIKLELKL